MKAGGRPPAGRARLEVGRPGPDLTAAVGPPLCDRGRSGPPASPGPRPGRDRPDQRIHIYRFIYCCRRLLRPRRTGPGASPSIPPTDRPAAGRDPTDPTPPTAGGREPPRWGVIVASARTGRGLRQGPQPCPSRPPRDSGADLPAGPGAGTRLRPAEPAISRVRGSTCYNRSRTSIAPPGDPMRLVGARPIWNRFKVGPDGELRTRAR